VKGQVFLSFSDSSISLLKKIFMIPNPILTVVLNYVGFYLKTKSNSSTVNCIQHIVLQFFFAV
jgi:hypothetical protein